MRQSRKKWERKREEQRNKVIAVLFIVMMVAAPALTTGAFVPIEWSVRTFMPTFDMSFFMGLSILVFAVGGHWNRDLSLRFPVLKAEDG